MKTITRTFLLLMALALAANAATIYTVGFEDWTDFDYNDLVFQVQGVSFHTTGTWTTPANLPYPNETPFPYQTASFFDSAVATGNIVSTFLFSQTAANDVAYIRIGLGAWIPVSGSTSIAASVGDLVSFRMQVNNDWYAYPDAAGNPDIVPRAIEASAQSPEPGTVFLMIGAGLMLVGWRRIGAVN